MTIAALSPLRAALTCMLAAVVLPAPAAQPVAWGSLTSAPAGTRAELSGIAAAARDAVLAVGAYNPGEIPTAVLTRPYAERWDGAVWTMTPVEVPRLYASQSSRLEAAVMLSPSDAWGVGHVDDIGSLASRTLAYRWDGSVWSRIATPDPAPSTRGNRLFAVTARAADEVYAAGETGYPARSMLQRWDGSAWSLVSVPDIGPLHAIAADTTALWVAGRTAVERLVAGRWRTLPTPPTQFNEFLQLAGIAPSGNTLWVVGTVLVPYFEGYVATPYAAAWRAGAWLRIPVPGRDLGLSGIVQTAAGLRASGTDGSVWRLARTGATADATPAANATRLDAIAADPEGRAWAAGSQVVVSGPRPALINAPGFDQGGFAVETGYAGASVTWIGAVTGSGTADASGHFQVGGLTAGSYTVVAAGDGCSPGVSTVAIAPGRVSAVQAHVQCP